MKHIKSIFIMSLIAISTFFTPTAQSREVYREKQNLYSFNDPSSDEFLTEICKISCFHLHIDGFTGTPFTILETSKKTGASIQHIIYSPKQMKDSEVNQKEFAKDIAYYAQKSAPFFLNKPELKGILKLRYILYTSEIFPFNYRETDMNDQNRSARIKKNELIKNRQKCDSEFFCTFFMLAENRYYPDEGTPNLNIAEFYKHYQSIPFSGRIHYPLDAPRDQAFEFVVLIGTNGKIISKDEANVLKENRYIY